MPQSVAVSANEQKSLGSFTRCSTNTQQDKKGRTGRLKEWLKMKTYAISETLPNAAKPMVAEAGTMGRREKQQEHQLPALAAYHATPYRNYHGLTENKDI